MLNINAVDGFKATPKYPIIAAVTTSGMILGINEMTIILVDLNKKAMMIAIKTTAKTKLCFKFWIK